MGRKGRGRSNHIPDGWQGCPPMGTGFVDDRFFVFKTPLKPDLNSKVPQPDRFSIENIFQRVQQMNNVSATKKDVHFYSPSSKFNYLTL